MSNDWYQDIVDFQEQVAKTKVPKVPKIPDGFVEALRRVLIIEEHNELMHAMQSRDIVGIVDGIVDCIVVLIGTAIQYGVDLRPIWDEVHRTNMAKAGGEIRSDGKVLKPKDWTPPAIAELLWKMGGLRDGSNKTGHRNI